MNPRDWEVLDLTPEQLDYVQVLMDAIDHPFPTGACWGNSQLMVLEDGGHRLTYWEGEAVGLSGFKVPHGWVVIDREKVVEVTWRPWWSKGGPLLQPYPEFEYTGVEISLEKIQEMASTGWLHSHLPGGGW